GRGERFQVWYRTVLPQTQTRFLGAVARRSEILGEDGLRARDLNNSDWRLRLGLDLDRKSRKTSKETGKDVLIDAADGELFEDVTIGLLRGGGLPSLLYERPAFTGDLRVFGDLAAHAPGLSTTLADLEAVLEAESTPATAPQSGAIDPAARAL